MLKILELGCEGESPCAKVDVGVDRMNPLAQVRA